MIRLNVSFFLFYEMYIYIKIYIKVNILNFIINIYNLELYFFYLDCFIVYDLNGDGWILREEMF